MATSDSTTPSKCCTKCGKEFPLSSENFYYSPAKRKWNARCINCAREDSREARRKWRAEHPDEAREEGKLEQRLFRQRNKEKLKIKDRQRRQRRLLTNPELERAKARAKYQRVMATNPEQLRRKGRRNERIRRARQMGSPTENHFTQADIDLHMKTQKGMCWWCGKKLTKYDIDHRIPLAKGGSNSANNICLACPTCNRSKNDKLPNEWCGRLL